MPIKITPIEKKKKSPKGGGPLMTPGQKKMLDKQTGKGKPQEAKSGGIMKKAGGGKVSGKVKNPFDIKLTDNRTKKEKKYKESYKSSSPGKMIKKAGGGKLKAVPEGKKGLSKLPTPVRNKMGFMKKGGMLNKKGKK